MNINHNIHRRLINVNRFMIAEYFNAVKHKLEKAVFQDKEVIFCFSGPVA